MDADGIDAMLIALLSAVGSESDTGQRLSERAIAGGSILQRQARLALKLDCKRIICLASGPRPSLIDLQHEVERAGAQFMLASRHRDLSGAVSATDRLLVLSDGVAFRHELAAEYLGSSPVILVLPAEPGVEAGFERIDRDHAWSGAMVLRGSAIEKLHELPGDIDCISSLLRIGLQDQTPLVPLDQTSLEAGSWAMVSNRTKLDDWSSSVAKQLLAPVGWYRPIESAVDHLVLRWARAGAIATRPGLWAFPAAGVLQLLALVLAALGYSAIALACAVIVAVLVRVADGFDLLLARPTDKSAYTRFLSRILHLMNDAVLLFALLIAPSSESLTNLAFPIIILLGLLHYFAVADRHLQIPVVTDRAVLAALLCASLLMGHVQVVTQCLAIIVLAFGLLSAVRSRLTQA